ncbi:pyrroline-5-carboxylate reductase [Aquibacillus kalidii]|uniref:pyrroline-5-carboxylate reductase n=1 Tax=Aquibacillus kalidii TaxID=2762597 RepID=UPI0016480785|nr:pyrroline-5-carboxylate reductase [Aquibacillus kalidii]
MTKTKLLFIGAGRMAQAMIAGLTQNGNAQIYVTNNGNQKRLEDVVQKYGIQAVSNWQQVINEVNVVILAIPPETHKELLKEMKDYVNSQLVVTVAAGIGPSTLEKTLPENTPVAWVMPNTAAELGESSTLYTLGKSTTSGHVQLLEEVLEPIGDYQEVSEQQVKQLTALTGSAPAFVYLMADALVNIARETGITETQARKIIAQMISGSAAMLQTAEAPMDLANQVATPGGSTAEGLRVLQENKLDELMKAAIGACRNHVG